MDTIEPAVAYAFQMGYGDPTEDADDTIIVLGDFIILPDENCSFFRVFGRTEAGDDVLIYAVASHRPNSVVGLNEQQLYDRIEARAARAEKTDADLDTAIGHIRRLIGPWRERACAHVDPAIVQDGAPTCMNHNRVGSDGSGSCAVAEAIKFVDDRSRAE